jgi:hypothetical protein
MLLSEAGVFDAHEANTLQIEVAGFAHPDK